MRKSVTFLFTDKIIEILYVKSNKSDVTEPQVKFNNNKISNL